MGSVGIRDRWTGKSLYINENRSRNIFRGFVTGLGEVLSSNVSVMSFT
jgi:hypothetical protein